MNDTVDAAAGTSRFGKGSELRRFIVFLAVGGLNTVVGYTIFLVIVLAGLGATAAAAGATILGALFNFKSIGHLVFANSERRLLPRFLMMYAVQCGANLGLLELAGRADVPVLVAEAFILPLLAVGSFLAMRRFVFAAMTPPGESS